MEKLMLTCKNKGHLLSLLLATFLGVNVQSVSARTTNPVGNFDGGHYYPQVRQSRQQRHQAPLLTALPLAHAEMVMLQQPKQ